MRTDFIQAGSCVTAADPVTADDEEVDNASAYNRSADVGNAAINADLHAVWCNVVDCINEAFAKYFC